MLAKLSNRRGTDPYARWWGRGGVARRPPIPIKANAFGLYDMQGNVWQWVEDCWHDHYKGAFYGAPRDGSAWKTECSPNDQRMVRGGAWFSLPEQLCSVSRYSYPPRYRYNFLGFRVGRTLTP